MQSEPGDIKLPPIQKRRRRVWPKQYMSEEFTKTYKKCARNADRNTERELSLFSKGRLISLKLHVFLCIGRLITVKYVKRLSFNLYYLNNITLSDSKRRQQEMKQDSQRED